MKTYIKLEGLVFKPDGWTEDQFDQFVDKMTELVESFGSEVPDHDIIFISAPCQSFSAAGQNLGIEDTRGTLFYETARIMEAKKPRYFIFENVKGLLSKKHERTFEIMCEVYSSLGYEIDFELINAKHWNVAQNRERVFMIGRLK